MAVPVFQPELLTAVAASFERLVTDLTRGPPACARERVTRPGPLVFCRFYPRMATRLRAELDDTSLGRSRSQLADLDGSHGPVSGVGHDLPDPTEECWARSAESLGRASASHPVRPAQGVHSRRCRSSALRYQLDHLMASGAFDGANLASLRAPDRRPRALKSRRRSKKSSSSHVTMPLSPAAPQDQEVLAPWPGPRHLRSDNRSSAPGAGWRPDVELEVWPDVAIAPTGSGRCASAGPRHSVRRPPERRESSAAADWPVCAAGPSRLWRAF